MDIALNLRKTSIIFISSDVSQERWGGGGGGLKGNVAMTLLVEKSICDAPLRNPNPTHFLKRSDVLKLVIC